MKPKNNRSAIDTSETGIVRTANKNTIKWAVETLYEVVVEKVNTLIMPNGMKKALVKLAPEYSAAEVATQPRDILRRLVDGKKPFEPPVLPVQQVKL